MSETASFRLATDWIPTGRSFGLLRFTLTNLSSSGISNFQLAFTSLFPLIVENRQLHGARLHEQFSNYQLITPPEGLILAPGANWSFSAELGYELHHYTLAVKSAYIVLENGAAVPVLSTPTTRNGENGTPRLEVPPSSKLPRGVPPLGVVPFPLAVRVTGARERANALYLIEGDAESEPAFHIAAELGERLFPSEPGLFAQAGDIACVARRTTGTEESGYRIEFTHDAVTLHASGQTGFFYGFITLGQILRASRLDPAHFIFPLIGEISDAPRFQWRAMLFDVARQVFHLQELSWLLDYLAWHKLNRFHLHLSDDEGWRLDIPGYPQLAQRSGQRGHGLTIPPLLGSSAAPYGIFYSSSSIIELIRRAERLMITVVPEIEMPGHSYSVLQALPELRDPDDKGTHRNVLNPAIPGTYDYIEAVITEVSRLFPSPWVHVGADEVPADAWAESPAAVRFMRECGFDQQDQLQSYFLRRVQDIVRAHGRCTGAWEEAALGGGLEPGDCYLVGWRQAASGLALAKQGYNVVLSPSEAYYLDMAQTDDWWDPGMDWAGSVSPERCYAFDPAVDWPAQLRTRLWGVQACLWSENLHDRKIFARLITPRLAAVAETAWTASANKNFGRFSALYALVPRCPFSGKTPDLAISSTTAVFGAAKPGARPQ